MEAIERHRHEAPKSLRVALITASSSRYERKAKGEPYKDESADVASRLLEDAGHKVVSKELVSDEKGMIREELTKCVRERDVDVIVISGGTGLARRDVTIEAVRPMLEKEMEGFGELFRRVSYERIGAPAIMSRALAGVYQGRIVLCLPGSPDGVETALKLIIEELPHMVYIARG